MQPKTQQLSHGNVNYYESEGTGRPLLLIHGNSCNGKTFDNQLNSPLGQRHRLVALDLPGHGSSDPFTELGDYSMPGYARVVTELAQALDMQEAALLGWSLGGHIILEGHDSLPQSRWIHYLWHAASGIPA